MGAAQNFISISRRALDVEDYIDMLRRHRSWIIGPTFAGLVVAVVVAFLWPDSFESYAVLRITPQVVSEQMVPNTVNMQIAQRLQGLQTEILSRSSLSSIISDEKLKLYPNLTQRQTMEDAIAQMIKDLSIRVLDLPSSGDRRFATAFRVTFLYPDKYKAQAVVQRLVTEFVNQNVQVQTKSARTTQNFLTDELKDAKEKLDGLLADIQKFQETNQGRLPQQAAANGSQLSSLQMRVTQANERQSSIQQSKASLETYLQGQQDMLSLVAQNVDESAPQIAIKNQNLINLDSAIRNTQAGLAALREYYTDSWPEVKKTEAQLRMLQNEKAKELAKMEDEQPATPAQAARPRVNLQQAAQIESMKNNINGVKTQINNANIQLAQVSQEKTNLDRQIQELQAKIDASPAVDQQYSQLSRDLSLAQAHYDDLKRRVALSETARDLQESGSGEQLEVLDPAFLPMNPSDPNRWAIAGIGIGVGLMLGLVLAGAKEAKDTSLKNLKDVRAYTNLPVLSSIPLLENALLVRRKRRLFWLAWSTAILVGVAAMSSSMWYYFMGGKL